MGALISVIGDRIGTRIGKKRLSVFGWRPKKTAVFMTIVTGMTVTLATLLVSSIFVENVRLALFEDIQSIKEKNRDLSKDFQVLSQKKSALEIKVKTLSSETENLASERKRLSELQAQTARDIEELRKERLELARQAEASTRESQRLKDEILKRNDDVKNLKDVLSRIEAENARLKEHEKSFLDENKNYQAVIDKLKTEKEGLIGQLNQSLNEKIVLKGVKEDLEQNLEKIREERSKSQELIEQIRTDLELARKVKSDLEKQVEKNMEEIGSKEDVLNRLKEDLKLTKAQIEEKNHQVQDSHAQLKVLNDKITELEQEAVSASETIENLQEIIQAKKQKRLVLRYMEPLISHPVQLDKNPSEDSFKKVFSSIVDEIRKNMAKIGVHVSFLDGEKYANYESRVFQHAKEIWQDIEDNYPFNEWPSKGVLVYPISENNLVEGESLKEVHFIVLENRLLILKGKEIARALLDASLPAEELLTQIFSIDDQIKKQMFGQGVLGNRFEPRTPKNIIQFAGIVDEIKALEKEYTGEPVYLSIVAGSDIYSNGNFSFLYNILTKKKSEEETRANQLKNKLEELKQKSMDTPQEPHFSLSPVTLSTEAVSVSQ
jgi:hypothetical protein